MERFTVVYVGGIGKDLVSEDDIKEKYEKYVKDAGHVEVTMCEENNGKAYALIKTTTEDLALKAIEQLDKKHLRGKKMAVSFFHAQRDDSIQYPIGDTNEYKKLINTLRAKLRHPTYIEDRQDHGRTVRKPLLPERRRGRQPEKWIEIQLSATVGNETSTTTLVIRNDNLYVEGFKNKHGKWFELRGPDETGKEKLPAEYYDDAQEVGWGVTYSGIMGLKDAAQVKRTLKTARLGKAFAERAVRRLSCYPHNEYNDDMPVRLGLAGLIVMICEAARMDPFLRHFAGSQDGSNSQGGAWDLGIGLEDKNLFVFLWNWANMSAALLKRKRDPYRPWDSKCGVASPREALDCVHLVRNSTKLDGFEGDGAQVVEILDISVNFGVLEIKFIDEAQRPRKIYTQKPNDETHRLELTVPGKCIFGHKWFSMEVFRRDDGGIRREFKWDCHKQAGRDNAAEFVVHTKIDLGSSDEVEVTYLVMSNTIKATVEVKLRLQDEEPPLPHEQDGRGDTAATAMEDVNKYTAQGKKDGGGSKKYTAHGKITAHIGGFEGYPPIVLFERSVEKPITLESSALMFPLDRSTIHVPQGKQLQIDMSTLDTSPKVDKKPGKVSFPSGKSRSDDIAGNDSAFAVDVGWDSPYRPEPRAVFIIGDNKGLFTDFIDKVRKVFHGQELLSDEALAALLNNPKGNENDPLADQVLQPSVEAPNVGKLFLTKPRQPEQWIHIELQVEGLSTTLVVQDGRCYGVGFMNQSKVWYDLGYGKQRRDDNKVLPLEYNSVLLGWGVPYKGILDVEDWEQVPVILNEAGLGRKSFAEKAVRTLSRYPDVDDDDDLMMSPRVALAGLIIMVCESARFNPLLKYFEDHWTDTQEVYSPCGCTCGSCICSCSSCKNLKRPGFSLEQMNYIWSWGKISRALLLWKEKREWPINDQTPILVEREIIDERDALDAVHLVYSDAMALEFYDGRHTKDELSLE